MNLGEGLRMAWLAIRGNVLRSFLTALGIIIGVTTVIAIVALGQGSQQAVTKQVESLGTNLVIAFPAFGGGARFTTAMAAQLQQRVPDISLAMPLFSSGGASVVAGTQNTQASVNGVSADWLPMHGIQMAQGSFLTAAQVSGHAQVAVLGQTVLQNLGIRGSAVGQQLHVNGFPFTVVGVLPQMGSTGGGNQDNVVLIPYTTAEIVLGTVYPNELFFQVKAAKDAPLVVGTLQMIFAHEFPRANAVNVSSQNQLLSTLSGVTKTLTTTLAAIAGVSLLVGGIGIMNIMLVSVTERTREIGLRKAIGAKRLGILLQFLLEAALLSCGGGVVGIGLGVLGAHLVGHALKTTVVVTPGSVVLGFGFALLVGMVFGLWPAAQGSRLDPIVALRHD